MSDKKINLYVDFDSTMVNSTKKMVEILNAKFGTNHNWEDIKQYDAKDLFPDCTRQDMLDVFASESFFEDLEIFDDCISTIQKYEDRFNIYIPTIGTSKNLFYKQKWCENNLPFAYKFIGIEKEGVGKDSIDMSNSILIDDHVDNLRTSNAAIKILYKNFMDTEWNEVDLKLKTDINFWVTEEWGDIVDTLKFILRINLIEV